MNGEIKTYKDLLNELQQLTPEQLEQSATIIIEDDSYGKQIASISPMEEDLYMNNDDDEDGGTIEQLKEIHGQDFKLEDYHICTPKGRIFIYSEF